MKDLQVQVHNAPTFEYKQSKIQHLPKVPLRGCVLGKSGAGKGVWLVDLILHKYRGCFERIYVFSPSVDIDHGWDAVKDYSEKELGVDPKKEQCFFSEWNGGADLARVVEAHAAVTAYAKKQKHKKLYSILVVIDDWAESAQVLHDKKSPISSLFLRGRHQGVSCIVSSQKLTCLDPVIRVNSCFWVIFRIASGTELNCLLEMFSALFPKDVLLAMYHKACCEEQYSFWYIDTTAHNKNDVSWLRWDGGRMTVQDAESDSDKPWGSPRGGPAPSGASRPRARPC